MSRKDQVFQAYNSAQHHVYDYIDNRSGFSNRPAATTSTPIGSNSTHHPSGTAPLPTYGSRPGSGDTVVPNTVLNAPPGQAQHAADQLPMSLMARGDARDARRAAAAIRREQKRSGQLKKKHTFASTNGRIVMEVHSTPQKNLTYMGGTAERGRGAMKGKVVVHAQDGERISAIRLKIKAVARVMIPKVGTPQHPFPLDQADPAKEPSTEKEITLLQLESKLYSVPNSTFPAGSTSTDPTFLKPGTYEFPFTVELPAHVKGAQLPPSFVLSPLNVQKQQVKSSIFKLPIPALSSDWATVKWYAKLTVERPGLFRANERIFAPFVYLPPPPSINNINSTLEKRARLAMEVDNALRRFHSSNYQGTINLESFIEPVSSWDEVKLNYGIGTQKGRRPNAPPPANEKSNEDKPGLFSRLLFGSQVEGPAPPTKETYSLSIPKNPHVFPLRSGIPFVLHRQVEWRGMTGVDEEGMSKIPHVVLFQRANINGRPKGPVVGTTIRLVTDSRQTPDTRPASTWSYEPKGSGKSQLNRRGESWLGVIDLPPTCTPCFDTTALTLDYYLSVRVGAGQSIEYLHSEPVVVCCPPPRPAQVPKPRPNPPSRTPSSAAVPNPRFPPSNLQYVPSRRPTSASVKSNLNDGLSKMSIDPHTSRPSVTSTPGSSPSSSRNRPVSQSHISPSASSNLDEKRLLHNQYHSQLQNPHTSRPSSTPPSRTQSPAPIHQTAPISTAASSRAPSEADTNEDEDADGEQSQWLFHEDELTDLPPSYFEATAVDQDD